MCLYMAKSMNVGNRIKIYIDFAVLCWLKSLHWMFSVYSVILVQGHLSNLIYNRLKMDCVTLKLLRIVLLDFYTMGNCLKFLI